MIELELPEPQFEELTLVNVDSLRGKGPGELEVTPLEGRVAVGGPHGFKITAERVAADPALTKFIDGSADRYDYYFVHMAVSFSVLQSPRIRTAGVQLTLTSVPGTPEPFALSIDPLSEDYTVKVEGKTRIVPSVKVLDQVELSLGDYEKAVSYDRTERVVRGVGLDGPQPGWEFTSTAAQELEGSYRLTMVVQAGYGTTLTVHGLVTATVRGNIPWRFARQLPNPLSFARAV